MRRRPTDDPRENEPPPQTVYLLITATITVSFIRYQVSFRNHFIGREETWGRGGLDKGGGSETEGSCCLSGSDDKQFDAYHRYYNLISISIFISFFCLLPLASG